MQITNHLHPVNIQNASHQVPRSPHPSPRSDQYATSLHVLIRDTDPIDAQCGTADACVLTETCSTFTRTTPTTTTFATCVPTPTCLKVYRTFPSLLPPPLKLRC